MFADIDVARVRLIHDLRYGMGVEDDAIPLVLSLLDQVYALRGSLQSVMHAIDTQPPAICGAILADLGADRSSAMMRPGCWPGREPCCESNNSTIWYCGSPTSRR